MDNKRDFLRYVFVIILCCFAIVGCEKKIDVPSTIESTANDEPLEYSFADLQEICDYVNNQILEKVNTLSEAEYLGLSNDETEQNKHRRKLEDKIVSEVIIDCEIPQGQKVVVVGYMGQCHQVQEGSWTEDVGKVFFQLKNSNEDDDWGGILCRSDDLSFLKIEKNSPIKIEATFMKPGTATGSGENLFECKIVE